MIVGNEYKAVKVVDCCGVDSYGTTIDRYIGRIGTVQFIDETEMAHILFEGDILPYSVNQSIDGQFACGFNDCDTERLLVLKEV